MRAKLRTDDGAPNPPTLNRTMYLPIGMLSRQFGQLTTHAAIRSLPGLTHQKPCVATVRFLTCVRSFRSRLP
ncbi:MAG: hypothetical protein ACRDNK_13480 [Solirubrobacteraceae bacterium]